MTFWGGRKPPSLTVVVQSINIPLALAAAVRGGHCFTNTGMVPIVAG